MAPAGRFGVAFSPHPAEMPVAWALDFLRRLLVHAAYGEAAGALADLRRAGLRIYSSPEYALLPSWDEEPLPTWAAAYRWQPGQSLRGVRYLLTFCPFSRLPAAVRRAYLAGELHLLPFPGSLLFFGAPPYLQLQKELPAAVQIPLLHSLHRHEAPWGIRIPQSGWLHEAVPGEPPPHADFGPLRNTLSAVRTAGPASIVTRTNWPPCSRRGPSGPRALQRRRRRCRPLRQADGPQRANLDPRVSPPAGRSPGRDRGVEPGGRAAGRGRPVRLSLLLSAHAGWAARSDLAPPPGGLSRRGRLGRSCCPTRRWVI